MNCPWELYAQATLPFCERRLCDWIVEPANAWSNLVVLAFAVLIFRQEVASRRNQLSLGPIVGVTVAILATGSFWLHATATMMGQVADLYCMYLLVAVFLIRQWNAQKLMSKPKAWLLALALSSVPTLIAWKFPPVGIPMFGVMLVLLLSLGIRFSKVYKSYGDRRRLAAGLALLALAFLAWTLDLSGAVCNPDNHFVNGHALWHALCGASIYCLFKYQNSQLRIS